MAIAFRSAATSTSEGVATESPAITAPAGLQDGDLIIVIIGTTTTNTGDQTLAGWTRIGPQVSVTDSALFIFYKIASSEGASWTFTDAFDGVEVFAAVALAYSGVDNSTPLDVAAIIQDNGAVGTGGEDTATITPNSNNCMIVSCAEGDGAEGHSGTPDADPECTERADYVGAGAACGWVYAQEHLQTTAAEEAHTITPSALLNCATAILALRPAAVGGASIVPIVMQYYRRLRA